MWQTFYPNDTKPYYYCANEYIFNDSLDLAIAEFSKILLIDSSQINCLLSIGDIYLNQHKFDLALDQYKSYLIQNPKSINAYSKIAQVYNSMDSLSNVKDIYEELIILDSGKNEFNLALGQVEYYLGNFDKASEIINHVVQEDSLNDAAYNLLAELCFLKGQITKYINHKEKAWSISNVYTQYKINTYRHLFLLNSFDNVERKIISLKQSKFEFPMLYPEYYNKLIYVDKLRLNSITSKEIEVVKKSINYREDIDMENIVILGIDIDYYYITALLLIEEENYVEAISRLLQISSLTRNDIAENIYHKQTSGKTRYDDIIVNLSLARCYRETKKFSQALDIINELLLYLPSCAEILNESALLHLEMGKKDKAIDELNKALEIWKDADPEFIPAQMVRDKLRELES
jgi:tetratricopeptide (TPR) repeat protein